MNSEKQSLRVVAQLTISPKTVSLVAEEDFFPFKKGQVVKRVTRATLMQMERPLNVIITTGGGIAGTQATVSPVKIPKPVSSTKAEKR